MVKIYNIQNSIVMKDDKNNSTVQFYFDFEPLLMFNKDSEYTYQEEIELQKKDITIEIDSVEDHDLYSLLASLSDGPLELVSASPMAHYTDIEKPNILSIINDGSKIKIILRGDRSESSTSVFLNPDLVDLDLFYKLIDALAKHLGILSSAENRKLMYTNYNRMFGDKDEN